MRGLEVRAQAHFEEVLPTQLDTSVGLFGAVLRSGNRPQEGNSRDSAGRSAIVFDGAKIYIGGFSGVDIVGHLLTEQTESQRGMRLVVPLGRQVQVPGLDGLQTRDTRVVEYRLAI